MSVCIGIDLGTTFSAMAYVDDHGDARVIPNGQTENITPSVILFEDEPGHLIVGKTAEEQSVIASDRVVQFVKREMGLSADKVRMSEDGVPQPYEFWGRTLTPEEISSYILKKLKKDAEAHLGETVDRAVITVPAYFRDPERMATETAGKLAGLEVLTTLNEPTAAALAYGVQRADKDQNVFVFDLGGGTLDVTFMRVEKNAIRMLHTDGDHRLGGKDWDDALMDLIVARFCDANPDVDPREDVDARQDLRQRAVSLKIQLSQQESGQQVWNAAGKRVVAKVTRAEFEEATEFLVDRCRGCAERAMEDLKQLDSPIKGWGDVDTVLLAGGSTRMPMIQALVEKITGQKPDSSLVNPDTCVAIGAAIRARQMVMEQGVGPEPTKEVVEKIGSIAVTNVLSHSLGVRAITDGPDGRREVVSKIVPRATPVPCERSKPYALEGAGDTAVVPIMQGEEEDPDMCTEIGRVLLRTSTQMAAGTPIQVTFRFNEGGMLKVNVKEGAGGTETDAEIERSGLLSAAQLAEAERHVKVAEVSG